MNKLYKILFLIPLLLISCKSNLKKENDNLSLKIENFIMKIYSRDGEKVYSVSSPYSSYNKDTQVFNLRETNIHLFKDNNIQYIINSDSSELSNNNKTLELNGNIIMKNLSEMDSKLIANKFIWNINSSEYLLTGNVIYENNEIILISSKAILNKSTNIIEFFNPVKYTIKGNINTSKYEIDSENAYYNINTNAVTFKSNESKVRSKVYF